ncbi:MAG: ABC transporter substrate-binding protein [Symbiobacteriaceae bacterium]|nr:ABC transporter substrate-binding protein [Symbiobacteriaceae bacterium]
MNKKPGLMVLLLTLILAMLNVISAAEPIQLKIGSVVVTQGSQQLAEPPQAPQIIGDRAMLPFRYLVQTILGGEVAYDNATRRITASVNGHEVVMVVDELAITIDGELHEYGQAPIVVEGSTLVPLRAFDLLVEKLEWEGTSETVTITLKQTEVATPVYPKPSLDKDRYGNTISVPAKVETIVSMAPSNTEIVSALGLAGKIVGADQFSLDIEGVHPDVLVFSFSDLDGEKLIDLNPDIIIGTGITRQAGAFDPYKVIREAGICVVEFPSSYSVEHIKEDILFIAAALDVFDRGLDLVASMDKEIAAISKIAETISEKKKVYFEVGHLYSLGNNNFIHSMIEIIGAVNILGDQGSWIRVNEEDVFGADPDVILTSADYLTAPGMTNEEAAIAEIKTRGGWDAITAIKNEAVYYIDTNSSSRANHNMVKALQQMAKAVYPELYP